ncbi:hypothetical protein XELAEV_18002096mg [Xenopus laevis]|uniref:Uncharacterized protein n=1 Tax=Xenopus laevis TaxID=8355 RepID=A0A974BQ11_XENLA|nr:hypothetical protein XELAEV_18002096mg [Xenopus laevis]
MKLQRYKCTFIGLNGDKLFSIRKQAKYNVQKDKAVYASYKHDDLFAVQTHFYFFTVFRSGHTRRFGEICLLPTNIRRQSAQMFVQKQ